VLQKLKYELKHCKGELDSAEETIKTLRSEKTILEQKLSVLEKRNSEEVTQKIQIIIQNYKTIRLR